MRHIAAIACTLSLATAPALAQQTMPFDSQEIGTVSPALEAYTKDDLFGKVWENAALSKRDRSLATVAALIARSQSEGLEDYIGHALDNGVTPAEISEVITHLAFYAGWQNAMIGVDAASDVFEERGISADRLPAANPDDMLPLDQEAEAARQSSVQERYGDVSQGVVDDTERLLFRDLWLRPGLEPRDRSLVTVAALIAAGHVDQITFHLDRAMDNGLTKDEASAMLSHLAFYAGWPNVFSAMPVAQKVFQGRDGQAETRSEGQN
ncbi:carboxymuconolactone decarboxylase family protein [Jiella avicenniae]|uniref:Carboxymuconolactone decarboxylase family protein n=1 Tax=Jiella avicenniae TaxID=2907202 RepID=A0A9X1P4G3_9HYPH|nr:carboxymuconolactone decarboxylase family protein [Jiella avicenniae]MCE7029584.1 carboxymuconolactone decarboxylase family protein [Jiella avicenniae]